MNIHRVANPITAPLRAANTPPMEAPTNGNPGIVPPWLQTGKDAKVEVIGVCPVGPDTPRVM